MTADRHPNYRNAASFGSPSIVEPSRELGNRHHNGNPEIGCWVFPI